MAPACPLDLRVIDFITADVCSRQFHRMCQLGNRSTGMPVFLFTFSFTILILSSRVQFRKWKLD